MTIMNTLQYTLISKLDVQMTIFHFLVDRLSETTLEVPFNFSDSI